MYITIHRYEICRHLYLRCILEIKIILVKNRSLYCNFFSNCILTMLIHQQQCFTHKSTKIWLVMRLTNSDFHYQNLYLRSYCCEFIAVFFNILSQTVPSVLANGVPAIFPLLMGLLTTMRLYHAFSWSP